MRSDVARIGLVFSGLTLTAAGGVAGQDLAGIWHLDTARSQLSNQLAVDRRTLKRSLEITVNGDQINVTDTVHASNAPVFRPSYQTYELDGKPRGLFNDLLGSPGRRRTAVWRQDRRGFDVEEADPSGERRMRSSWRLSADGRTLTVEDVFEPLTWQETRIFVREEDVQSLPPPSDFEVGPIFVAGGPVFVFTCPNLIGSSLTVTEFFEGMAVQINGVVYPYVGPVPQSVPFVQRLRVVADLRQDRTLPPPRYPGAGRLAWSIPITDRWTTVAFRCAGEWSDLINFLYAP